MLSAEDEEELKGFEARVDEVMGILNLMQSNVKKDSEAAIEMADKYFLNFLKKVSFLKNYVSSKDFWMELLHWKTWISTSA